MNLEEEVKKLQRQIDELRTAKNIEFTESLKKHVVFDVISAGVNDATLSGINDSTVVPAGGGTVDHAAPYDRRLRVIIDGADYYIGLYNT
jgi:hypothetical protein